MQTIRSYSVLSRAAALAAIVYFLLLFVVPPDGPAVETATASQVRAYYTENASALHASALAAAVAGPAILIFCACLARLVTIRIGASVWPPLIVASGALVAVWHWLTAAIDANVSVQALDGTSLTRVSDGALTTWYALTNVSHLWGDLAMVHVVMLMAASSLAARTSGVLPRWLCWAGLALALAGAIGTVGVALALGPLAYAWFAGLFGWTLWIPTCAVALLIRARRRDVGVPGSDQVATTPAV